MSKPKDFDPPEGQLQNERRIYREVFEVARIGQCDDIVDDVNSWFDRCKPRRWVEVDPWEEDFTLQMTADPDEPRPPLEYRLRDDVAIREDDRWHVWTTKDHRPKARKAFLRKDGAGGTLKQAQTKALEVYRATQWFPYIYLHGPDDYEDFRKAQAWLHSFGYGLIERKWPKRDRSAAIAADGFDLAEIISLKRGHPTFQFIGDWFEYLARHHASSNQPQDKEWWMLDGLNIADLLYQYLHGEPSPEVRQSRKFLTLWEKCHPFYCAEWGVYHR